MQVKRASARLLWICATGLLIGCGTETIKVSDGALVDKVDYQWLASDRSKTRAVFSPDDEQVTLSVHFDYNLRAAYEWYRVEWLDPTGKPYKVLSTRTEFGSHRDIQAHIKIAGKMAAKLPGLWRVRLYHLNEDGSIDRLLFARLFRIAEVSAVKTVAAIPLPANTTQLSTALAAETGITAATLTVQHADAATKQTSRPPLRRRALGCPPLYYPPDQGCVEESPEE